MNQISETRIKPFFDIRTTNIIKGIAIILMFLHHFFTYPSWWIDGITYPFWEAFSSYLCAPFRICVSVFCFLTGYTYFYKNDKTFKESVRKIFNLFIPYCIVLLLLSGIAIFFSIKIVLFDFFLEVLALKTDVMIFCWYVLFYYAIMLIFPLFNKIIIKNNNIFIALPLVLIAFPFLCNILRFLVKVDEINALFYYLANYSPIVFIGYFSAQYDIFSRIEKKLKEHRLNNTVTYFVLLILSMVLKLVQPTVQLVFSGIGGMKVTPSVTIPLDIIYVVFFIFSISMLIQVFGKTNKFKYFEFVLEHLGKLSMIMWFVSCVFFNISKQYTQRYLYISSNWIVSFLWGTVLIYVVSYTLDRLVRHLKIEKR